MTNRLQRKSWVLLLIACAAWVALVTNLPSTAFAQKRAPSGRKSRPAAATPAPEPAPSSAAEPATPAEQPGSPAPEAGASAPSTDSAGSGTAPAPAPSSGTGPDQAPLDTAEDDAELAALRQELAQVMDDLVQAR